MKVSNYRLCNGGNRTSGNSGNRGNRKLEQRQRNGAKITIQRGFNFKIRRLSLTRSSEGEEQEKRILKSSRDAVWPVSERCAKILDRVAVAPCSGGWQ